MDVNYTLHKIPAKFSWINAGVISGRCLISVPSVSKCDHQVSVFVTLQGSQTRIISFYHVISVLSVLMRL